MIPTTLLHAIIKSKNNLEADAGQLWNCSFLNQVIYEHPQQIFLMVCLRKN